MKTKVKLAQLATLRSGVTLRKRVTDSPKGTHHLFQFRDLDKTHYNLCSATRIDGSAFDPKHLLQVGDILFTAKGAHNKAILYTQEHQQQYPNTLALSIFTIIKVIPELILPEYLVWYINSPSGQQALEPFKGGSVIPSISNTSLRQLPITLPTLEKQHSIIQLVQLLEREEELHLEIIKEKKRLINQVIYEKIQ